MSGPIVMRPKSMATVVPVFCIPGMATSMPRLSTVISASVRSGSISEIEPMNVVLPTAKPPATTIFIDTGMAAGRRCAVRSKSAESIEQPLEECDIRRRVGRSGRAHQQRARRLEIADEHPDDADGKRHASGELGDRDGLLGQLDD